MAHTKPQIQETQNIPDRINAQQTTLKHIMLKLQKIKDKEKILKEARGKEKKKELYLQRSKIRISSNFSTETM